MQQYMIADGRDQQVDADRVIRSMLIDELQSTGHADWIRCGSRVHIAFFSSDGGRLINAFYSTYEDQCALRTWVIPAPGRPPGIETTFGSSPQSRGTHTLDLINVEYIGENARSRSGHPRADAAFGIDD